MTDQFIYIRYDGVEKLKGITAYLEENHSLYDEIEVLSSSIYLSQPPINAFKPDNTIFTTLNEDVPWIQISFINKKLYLKNYAIKVVTGNGTSNHFPKKWIIRGSNDNITWKIIDRKNVNIFQEKGQIEIFDCDKPSAYQHIQMVLTGKTCNSELRLRFQQMELFGTLYPKQYDFYPEILQSCKCNYLINKFIYYILCISNVLLIK